MEPLKHRRYQDAMRAIAELHLRRRVNAPGSGLLLTGPSGVGKSTTIHAYHSFFPRQHEQTLTRIPVLLVSVPSSPTVRSLAGAILEALGVQYPHRGTAPERTTSIHGLFDKCGVEMILLDEFHHLLYAPTLNAFRDVTDWLKSFLDQTGVGLVACGLSTGETVVSSNEQLTRRFSARITLSPFDGNTDEDILEFRGVLKTIGTYLPIRSETPLYEANLARRIHIGSYGLLDYVQKIVEGAVSATAIAGKDFIDMEALATGFRNRIWQDAPDRLNPFHPDSLLRPLDRAGEVFHQYTHHDLIGSPVARKLGMNLAKGS